jgi:hypothetical protein
MKTDQRYVSNELSHFVGSKSLNNVQEQYSVLKTILRNERITHDPNAPHTKGIETMGLYGNINGSFASNTMYNPNMVCFCDIPASDLAIHTAKYGVCGLSFSKEFLAEKGVVPVFYTTKNAAAEFDEPAKRLEILFDRITRCNQDELPPELKQLLTDNPNAVREIKYFLHFKIFSYIQCFDCSLNDGDPKNYYFEREWRSLYDIEFVLDDVQRIFIPMQMSKQFRNDFPNYYGQITFTEDFK